MIVHLNMPSPKGELNMNSAFDRSLNARRQSHLRAKLNRRGGTSVLLALLLPLMILLAAFAINFAHMELSRTEAFVAADAAARAGGREFALTGDQSQAIDRARQYARLNPINRRPTQLDGGDIVFGTSNRGGANQRYSFDPSGSDKNSLQVTIRRNASGAGGPVNLLMPDLLGRSQFELQKSSVSTRVEVDIALVIDRSGSMAYASDEVARRPPNPAAAPPGWDFGQAVPNPSRWLDLVNASQVFVQELNNSALSESVSLVTYAGSGRQDTPMTDSYGGITSALNNYSAAFAAGETNIGDGLRVGVQALAGGREYAAKVVILMTDGIRSTGPNPVNIARTAGRDGIIIFTVTFANEADQAAMRAVADEANGKHFHANSGLALQDVFRQVARSMPTVLTK